MTSTLTPDAFDDHLDADDAAGDSIEPVELSPGGLLRGLRAVDLWVLGALFLWPCAFLPMFANQSWTPRVMVMLVALPTGALAIWSLLRRRDRAAMFAAAAVGWTLVGAAFSGNAILSLKGVMAMNSSVLIYAGSFGLWATARFMSVRGRAFVAPVFVSACAVNVLVGLAQVVFRIDSSSVGRRRSACGRPHRELVDVRCGGGRRRRDVHAPRSESGASDQLESMAGCGVRAVVRHSDLGQPCRHGRCARCGSRWADHGPARASSGVDGRCSGWPARRFGDVPANATRCRGCRRGGWLPPGEPRCGARRSTQYSNARSPGGVWDASAMRSRAATASMKSCRCPTYRTSGMHTTSWSNSRSWSESRDCCCSVVSHGVPAAVLRRRRPWRRAPSCSSGCCSRSRCRRCRSR